MTVPRPLHNGRPGAASTVIPDGWSAAHQGVVDDTLDCTVTIGPAGGAPSYDPDSRVTVVPTVSPVYAGPASVGLTTVGGSAENGRAESAEDQVEIRAYRIKLPATDQRTALVEVDHVLVVTGSPNDALTGTRLVVTGVATPGREFSRVITARLYT